MKRILMIFAFFFLESSILYSWQDVRDTASRWGRQVGGHIVRTIKTQVPRIIPTWIKKHPRIVGGTVITFGAIAGGALLYRKYLERQRKIRQQQKNSDKIKEVFPGTQRAVQITIAAFQLQKSLKDIIKKLPDAPKTIQTDVSIAKRDESEKLSAVLNSRDHTLSIHHIADNQSNLIIAYNLTQQNPITFENKKLKGIYLNKDDFNIEEPQNLYIQKKVSIAAEKLKEQLEQNNLGSVNKILSDPN